MAKTDTPQTVPPSETAPSPVLAWETPPSAGVGRPSHGRYEEIVKALQAKPGEWAVIQVAPKDKNSRLSGPQKQLKTLGAEAMTRTVELSDKDKWTDTDGSTHVLVAKLYVRWPVLESA